MIAAATIAVVFCVMLAFPVTFGRKSSEAVPAADLDDDDFWSDEDCARTTQEWEP